MSALADNPPVNLVVCDHCDTVHRRIGLPAHAHAHCMRCGNRLYGSIRARMEVWLALSVASAVVFVIANVNPIVELQLRGEYTRASLVDAVVATWGSGALLVALLAALSAFLFPMLRIALELYLLGFLYLGQRPPGMPAAMRLLRVIRPWSMIEVLMLGMLVAVVKLGGSATVIPGAGIVGFAVMTALLAVLATFDPDTLWDHAEQIPG